jgi:uncharacterized protein (TIGR02246 family)
VATWPGLVPYLPGELARVVDCGAVGGRLPGMASGHPSPEASDPIAVVGRFIDAWNGHDMHALGDLFADDADFIDVFGNWFKGRTAFEQVLAQRHRSVFAESRFTRKDVAVRQVSPGLAIVHAVIELAGATSPGGQPLAPALGVMGYVMEREGPEGWRILAFQNTAVMPPGGR